MKYEVILPAAGSGKRMGAGENKLFLKLIGIPILIHTLKVFQEDDGCSGIWLAAKPEEQDDIRSLLREHGITKLKSIENGGAERQHSVHACVKVVEGADIVLVHDAARPFIHTDVIHRLVDEAARSGAAVAGVRAKDTMKLVKDGVIQETVNRENLWIIQTPQAFKCSLLKEAEANAEADGFLGTDEAMLIERLGHPVAIVESTYDNIKMTTVDDLIFGEAIIKSRQEEN
jgi:2-C-methyl-D-erythritol 4-phosphate cytidylyltransferase